MIMMPTTATLQIADREANKESTTSLSPSFLLMTLKGLNALRALRAFIDLRDLFLEEEL